MGGCGLSPNFLEPWAEKNSILQWVIVKIYMVQMNLK